MIACHSNCDQGSLILASRVILPQDGCLSPNKPPIIHFITAHCSVIYPKLAIQNQRYVLTVHSLNISHFRAADDSVGLLQQ
jgi:hypothetical protein